MLTRARTSFRFKTNPTASSLRYQNLASVTQNEMHNDDADHNTVGSNQSNQYFPNLFEPLNLKGGIRLPNRVVMGSMHSGLEGHSIPKIMQPFLGTSDSHGDENGLEKMAVFFEERAKGGVGLMVTGGISPNSQGWTSPFASKLDSIEEMEKHKIVTGLVHSVRIPSYNNSAKGEETSSTNTEETERARICLQILHAGRYSYHPFAVSASSTKSPISPFPARGLTLNEVKSTIFDYVNCAVLAKEANYDGVEIMGSEGYLINQFLVSSTNNRSDCYGGDFLNRIRFAVEIVSNIRQAVGDDFIIIFRLSMIDLCKDGSSWDEVKILAQAIEDAGATIINTGIGWHESRIPTIHTSVPRGIFAGVTKKLRDEKIVSIPLCATNRINSPHVGEKILREQSADLISMARPFLADADIVMKSREGKMDEINTCIACNQACLDHVFVGKVASCLVNPRACHETELDISENSVPLKERVNIGVVGAGPAGLAFACTAATIGHNVILFDKSSEIGGQFNMAKRIPGKEEFYETIRYFNTQLKKLQGTGKLSINLNTEVSYSDMKQNGAIHKWIVATGVKPRVPSIPGIDHPNVLSYIDVLKKNKKVGQRVAIIGAGGIGFDVAEYLLHHDDSQNDITADKLSPTDFFSYWGVDSELKTRGGLLAGISESSSPVSSGHSTGRKLFLMQRKDGKLGKGLGKTTGWIHRTTLNKSNAVEMIHSVVYDKIDNEGNLHITISKGNTTQKKILEVDNIIVAAGQESNRELSAEEIFDNDKTFNIQSFTIGGAYEALELDAKRAIDMGTRLALRINDENVTPGKHVFAAGDGPEGKLYQILQKFI